MTKHLFKHIAIGLGLAGMLAVSMTAQAPKPSTFSDMHWRSIGPPRAGRARALVRRARASRNVFYIGFDNGGVWRSTDFGSTWMPLFDSQPTGSIGAIGVAPSDPNVIYVGSGAGIIRPDLVDRRRHVQVHRRRQDVDASRQLRDTPDDREHRRRSEESESAVRRGARPSVRSERRSAASSDRPTAARRSRRCSTRTSTSAATTCASIRAIRTSSTPRSGSSSRASSKAARSAATRSERRRHLQVDRRRHDVEAADRAGLPAVLEANLAIAPSNSKVIYATVACIGPCAPTGARCGAGAAPAGAAGGGGRRRRWRRRDRVLQDDRRRRSLVPRDRRSARRRNRFAASSAGHSVRSAASAAAICRRSPSIRRTRTSSTAARRCSGARKTAA